MQSAPATIPAISEVTFSPAFAPFVRWHAQVLISQFPQSRRLSQRQRQPRDQPSRRPEIRIIERHRRPAKSMRESHLRDALRVAVELLPEELQFSRHTGAFSRHDALTSPTHRWIEAKPDRKSVPGLARTTGTRTEAKTCASGMREGPILSDGGLTAGALVARVV